jgi:hypothetical protein
MNWKNAQQAAVYLGNRGKRFIHREVKAGRLRAARLGGRGELVTCDAWLDEYVEQQAKPVVVNVRRRA